VAAPVVEEMLAEAEEVKKATTRAMNPRLKEDTEAKVLSEVAHKLLLP